MVYATTEDGWFLGNLAFVATVLVCLPRVLPLDALMLVLIVAWTLPQFRSEKDSPTATFVLGLLTGAALLVKFNIGVAGFLGGLALFSLRAWSARKVALSSRLETLFIFVVGVQLVAFTWFARLDYGVAGASALVLVTLLPAAVLARGRGPHRRIAAALGLGALCVLAVSPSYRAFVGSSVQLAEGYSSAMSLEGPPWEIGFVLCVLAMLVLSLMANVKRLTFPVIVALLIALFFGFKEGFVRQDLHVVYAFWSALVVAGTVVRLSAGNRLRVINAAVVLLTVFALEVVVQAYGAGSQLEALTPASFARDLARFNAPWHYDMTVNSALSGLQGDRLPPSVVKAFGRSPVDVQPFETSIIFANGFTWDPEPSFQAYFAFTPALDRTNAEHLDSAGAAKVLFHWNAIDGRHPLWDQPAATRKMICHYALDPAVSAPISTESQLELLAMKQVPNRCDDSVALSAGTYSWRQAIMVPPSTGLLFMDLSVQYSPLGEVVKTLFRAPAVWLRVVDSKGEESKYRIVIENGVDGLLIGPLPQSLEQLRSLLNGEDAPKIRSVDLETDAEYFFRRSFPVSFRRVSYK